MILSTKVDPLNFLSQLGDQEGIPGLLSLAQEAMTMCMHKVRDNRFDSDLSDDEKHLFVEIRNVRESIEVAGAKWSDISNVDGFETIEYHRQTEVKK